MSLVREWVSVGRRVRRSTRPRKWSNCDDDKKQTEWNRFSHFSHFPFQCFSIHLTHSRLIDAIFLRFFFFRLGHGRAEECTKKSAIIYDSFIHEKRNSNNTRNEPKSRLKCSTQRRCEVKQAEILLVGIGHRRRRRADTPQVHLQEQQQQQRTREKRAREREENEEWNNIGSSPVTRDLLTRFLNVYIPFDMWFFRFWLSRFFLGDFFLLSSLFVKLFSKLCEILFFFVCMFRLCRRRWRSVWDSLCSSRECVWLAPDDWLWLHMRTQLLDSHTTRRRLQMIQCKLIILFECNLLSAPSRLLLFLFRMFNVGDQDAIQQKHAKYSENICVVSQALAVSCCMNSGDFSRNLCGSTERTQCCEEASPPWKLAILMLRLPPPKITISLSRISSNEAKKNMMRRGWNI